MFSGHEATSRIAGGERSVAVAPLGFCNVSFSFNMYHNASGGLTNSFPGNTTASFPGYPAHLNLKEADATFAQWQAAGGDRGSVEADPEFTSARPYDENDLRISASSPAVGVGFNPFDLRGSGPSGAIARR